MKKEFIEKIRKTTGKKITIDMLAVMMSKGFDRLENMILGETNILRSEMNQGFKKQEDDLFDKIDKVDHRTIMMKQVIEKDLKTPVRW